MIGFVFQEFNLLDNMTIRDNIALPLTLNNRKPEEILRKVRELTALFGIDDQLDKYPDQLSGGQEAKSCCLPGPGQRPQNFVCRRPTGRWIPEQPPNFWLVFRMSGTNTDHSGDGDP